MRGLRALPQTDDLLEAYREIEKRGDGLRSDQALSEKQIAVYSQWSRLDPRLAELFTGYLERWGHEIHIFRFLRELESLPWPRAILVPLRFAEIKLTFGMKTAEASLGPKASRVATLHALINSIDRTFPEKSNDLFFIPLQRLNRVLTDEMIDLQTEPYARAGFIGSAPLFAKGQTPDGATLMTKGARERLLLRMIGGKPASGTREDLTVDRYMTACRGLVSRRQAQRDLDAEPRLKAIGFTRNRRYRCV